MAVLGLRFCARAFSSCGKQGPLFITVRGPLTVAASLVAEHRLQTRRLSSCGSRAQLLRGMWDLPRPGLEPVSPALAGRFPTTAPPGKPYTVFLKQQEGHIKITSPHLVGRWPLSSGSLIPSEAGQRTCHPILLPQRENNSREERTLRVRVLFTLKM